MVCRLYKKFCRRYGPRGMTFSAFAWVYAQETGNTFYRDRIDGLWLLIFGVHHHCQSAFQRQRRAKPNA